MTPKQFTEGYKRWVDYGRPIPTLGNGILFEVHRNRQRMIRDFARKEALCYIGAIAVGLATIIWLTWL